MKQLYIVNIIVLLLGMMFLFIAQNIFKEEEKGSEKREVKETLNIIVAQNIFEVEEKSNEKIEVKETLKIFQEGYVKRDTTKIIEWCHNIFFDNVEIIRVYSTQTNTSERLTGREKAINAFKKDWVSWGDFEVNLETANIDLEEDFAWVSFEATLTQLEQGDEYICPLRITGALQKKDDIWRFRQMHFAHGNTNFLSNKEEKE